MSGQSTVHIVLLSGGSGVRLWPLSNSIRSKQFLKVLRSEDGCRESMAQRVFRQIEMLGTENYDVTIVTGSAQVEALKSQLTGSYSIVVEPERRDTAPAILLASAYLRFQKHANIDDTIIVMPIDAYVDESYYRTFSKLDAAVSSGDGDLVLLGAMPSFPSEKYGYIIPDLSDDATLGSGVSFPVKSFVEKPSTEMAKRYIELGALWNCGVFCFKLRYAVALLSGYGSFNDFEKVVSSYSALPKNSFDYEVVEKADSISVVPFEGAWKDLGTWNTLTEEMANASEGLVVASEIDNVHIINETSLPLIVKDLSDAVIAATPDGILVSSKEASVSIKEEIGLLGDIRPMYEKRRWGEYRVLDNQTDRDNKVLVKELIINRDKQISYQKHSLRSEYWIITEGEGDVIVGDSVSRITPGSVVRIAASEMHAVRATETLRMIEIQLGSKLTEDDIERHGDYWPSECD